MCQNRAADYLVRAGCQCRQEFASTVKDLKSILLGPTLLKSAAVAGFMQPRQGLDKCAMPPENLVQ